MLEAAFAYHIGSKPSSGKWILHIGAKTRRKQSHSVDLPNSGGPVRNRLATRSENRREPSAQDARHRHGSCVHVRQRSFVVWVPRR